MISICEVSESFGNPLRTTKQLTGFFVQSKLKLRTLLLFGYLAINND